MGNPWPGNAGTVTCGGFVGMVKKFCPERPPFGDGVITLPSGIVGAGVIYIRNLSNIQGTFTVLNKKTNKK